MPEINLRCWYGMRWKDGKVIRSATCHNRASGIWKVYFQAFGRVYSKSMLLCADCGFNKMPNRVKAVETENGELMFYHDVVKTELIKTLDTEFKQNEVQPQTGHKHWVDAKVNPKALASKFTRKRIASRKEFKPLDMAAYRKSLREHDDGK